MIDTTMLDKIRTICITKGAADCGITCGGEIILSEPWSDGEYTMASDGAIIVRVPRIAEVTREAYSLHHNEIMRTSFEPHRDGSFIPLLSSPVNTEPCSSCAGTGRRIRCPECDGEGVVSFRNHYHEYEVDCQSCSGAGRLYLSKHRRLPAAQPYQLTDEPCDACSGIGVVSIDEAIKIGDAYFSSLLITKLAAVFDGLTICPLGPFDPAPIRFAAGEGLLMPRKP